MKSNRYEVLPRVSRQYSTGMWKCTWVEPIGLQRKGEPVVGPTYTGVGFTADEAMKMCRLSYMLRTEIDKRRKEEVSKAVDSILSSLERESRGFPPNYDSRMDERYDHLLPTSKLPWWRRLFRV